MDDWAHTEELEHVLNLCFYPRSAQLEQATKPLYMY